LLGHDVARLVACLLGRRQRAQLLEARNMVIGDEDGTCLDRGVDPVLKEWRLTAGGAGEPPARRGGAGGSDVWICARDGEERRVRRRRSGWVQADDAAPFLLRPGRQRRLRRMLPAPVANELQLAASERRRDRGPAWSSSSSSWNISSLVRKKLGQGRRRKSAASLCRRRR
jgi:hypothetical protein